MTLHFTLTEDDALALSERYLRDSKLFQATRTRLRWALPGLLIVILGYYAWLDLLSPIRLGTFAVFGAAWWFMYPRRFDARIRSHARKQMAESSYSKFFGPYELQLVDEHLQSTSRIGSGTYTWAAVDRVAMDAVYLYIFLSGPLGYSIRIAEIGQDTAQRAHDFIAERIRLTRQSSQPQA